MGSMLEPNTRKGPDGPAQYPVSFINSGNYTVYTVSNFSSTVGIDWLRIRSQPFVVSEITDINVIPFSTVYQNWASDNISLYHFDNGVRGKYVDKYYYADYQTDTWGNSWIYPESGEAYSDGSIPSLTPGTYVFEWNIQITDDTGILSSDNTVWTCSVPNIVYYFDSSSSGTPNPDPEPPSTTENAVIEFNTLQVLANTVSCVVDVSGLGSEESIYTLHSELISGNTVYWTETTEAFAGPSAQVHNTVTELMPETEYTMTCTLYENGTPTSVAVSQTFTTLAASGSGGGGDTGTDDDTQIDYTGKLDSIENSVNFVGDKVDGVGDKVDSVGDKVEAVKEEITSLPEKIANMITDGIKGLFIPSQEDLTAIRDEYETMLSEKLGFIWQAFDLLTGFVGDLQTSLESGDAHEFTFPGVTVPIDGKEYVFIAETPVSLDNALMDVLRPVLGTIVSIVCVIAFVNMAHDYVLAIVSGVSAYEFERRKE